MSRQETIVEPSTVEFANILQEFGLKSHEAEEYKRINSEDRTFQKRATVIEELFRQKIAILAHLESRK